MAENPIDFLWNPEQNKNVFAISGKAVFDPANPAPGSLTFNITNASNDWIDVVGESYFPVSQRLFTTGRMDKGAAVGEIRQLAPYVGQAILLTRWAPGFAGSRNGGGEVRFIMPSQGNVTIDISISNPK